MTELPIYLINLDGSDARLDAATSAMEAENVPFIRHAAFDGRYLDLREVPEYGARAARALMGRDLTGGEVGCFISHVEVAKRLLSSDADFALVLEDDMKPLPGGFALTRALIAEARAGRDQWDVAHLGAEKLKIATPLHLIEAGAHRAMLHRAHYFPMRTTALLWSRTGAERFVQTAYPITCPVDIHLRRLMQQNDGGVALSPSCFTTTDAESEIVAAAGKKRGTDSRSPTYPIKRAARVIIENRRASLLQRRARRGLT
ncbi:glycosyltransferase family 25 protein [Marimonas sp. MJW-29]|uniref:Glycosyltransferase family 25 protein n=1 Tax=Sulfitobacter sediminis TaxID=3234186 RepID=A0ABV3RLQ9_9RHOB